MSMIKFVLILTLITTNEALQSNKYSTIEMMKDFLLQDTSKSIMVVAYVCWQKDDKTELLNILFENNYRVKIKNISTPNITTNSYYPYNYGITYLVDLDCAYSTNILIKANTQYLFTTKYKWFLVSKNQNTTKNIKDLLSNLNIYQNSNIFLAEKIENDKYLLQDLYRQNEKSKNLLTKVVSIWTMHEGFNNFRHFVNANERRNVNGALLPFSIVVQNNDTLNHLNDYRNIHIDSVSKSTYQITRHLIDYTNATTKMFPVSSWGYRDNTTRYMGMMGYLQRKEVEIGGTPMFITEDRIPIVDFVAMTTPTKVRFVFRPPPLSYTSNLFTLPFSRSLWISAFCLVILATLLLYAAVSWEFSQNFPGSPLSTPPLKPSLQDIILLSLGAVAQQGASLLPTQPSGRIVSLIIFTALMFLYTSYSANIVALLQSSSNNINTLQDLLRSRLKLAADDTVYNRYYFKTATGPIHRAIYTQRIAPHGEAPHFIPLAEGVRRLREGFFAFHMELGPGYKLVSDTFLEGEKCGLKEITYLPLRSDAYMAIRKNSSVKEVLTLGLRKMQEGGLQNREISRIYTKRPECHGAGGIFVSVGLVDAYPAFLFLGGGILLACTILVAEKALNKYQGRGIQVRN